MTVLPAHGSAPKVMSPQAEQRCVRSQVLVVHYGTDIIKDESAIECIEIDRQCDCQQFEWHMCHNNNRNHVAPMVRRSNDTPIKVGNNHRGACCYSTLAAAGGNCLTDCA